MKAKKAIIAVIITLLVLCGLGAGGFCLWKFTDLFNFLKPANEVFSNQMEKALNMEGAKFTDYSDFLKEYKDNYNKPYKLNLNMSANLNLSELDSETKNIINKSKIKYESNADQKNNKIENKIGLYSNNSEVLTVDIINNDKKLAIGCKDLSDKYIAVSAEDLVKYMKENRDKDISDEDIKVLENALSGKKIDPYEFLYISDEDLKYFDERYGDILNTLISKDCYTTEKNVEVDVDDDEVKTTAYYLTLTGEDTYKFVEDLSNLVKDDSVLTKILVEKANMVLENAGQNKIDEKDVKEAMNDVFGDMLKELDSIKNKDEAAIQIAIYSDKSKPVRIELNTLEDVSKKSDKETLLSVEYAKGKTIYTMYQKGKAYITATDEYEKNSDKERKGKVSLKAMGTQIGTIDYELVKKDAESKVYLSLNIPLADISANIDISSKGNPKKEAVDITGKMSFKYAKESAEINFDGKAEFTDDVSIPELSSSNSIEILKLSKEDQEKELDKIMKKASEVLPARLKLIGINVKAEDIYKEKKVEEKVEDNDKKETATPATPTINQEELDKLQKLIESNPNLLNTIR